MSYVSTVTSKDVGNILSAISWITSKKYEIQTADFLNKNEWLTSSYLVDGSRHLWMVSLGNLTAAVFTYFSILHQICGYKCHHMVIKAKVVGHTQLNRFGFRQYLHVRFCLKKNTSVAAISTSTAFSLIVLIRGFFEI